MSLPFGKYKGIDMKTLNKPNRIKKFLTDLNTIMDDAVWGHNDAKRQIIQMMGQQIRNPKSKGNVLGIYGCPGNGKTSLVKNPSLINQLSQPMNVLTNKEVKQIDKKVILDAEDATSLIQNLRVKAIALKGKEDYVPTPPKIETIVVEGGHISPLEKPEEVLNLIKKLTK
jgi:AAA+ superfamily predicted ATPase